MLLEVHRLGAARNRTVSCVVSHFTPPPERSGLEATPPRLDVPAPLGSSHVTRGPIRGIHDTPTRVSWPAPFAGHPIEE
jgi:hypothetical protein